MLELVYSLESRRNRGRLGRRIILITAIFCLVHFLIPVDVRAEPEKPKPNTSTYADYYVSGEFGDDKNPGTFTQPFRTPGHAVDVLHSLPDPSGKIVLIRGGLYRWRDDPENRLFLKSLHGSAGAPIQIRGYPGETVILDAFEKPFNPLAKPFEMACGWGGISINASHHLLVENFIVCGRRQCNIEILNSNWITIRYIASTRSDKHGLFTGGSFHHLTVECCKFYEQMYGSTSSHGLYISGGHWDPALPPVRNIWIRYVECYYNGRHGIQLNGRIEDVVIEHCNLHHNVLGGLSLIGVRNARVHHNLIYKNNKQGIILYTYFDHDYWDIQDPRSVAHWKSTHWTVENVQVDHNTIFMDYIPWYIDEWTAYNPTYHAALYQVDTSGFLSPFDKIYYYNNIIYNHSDMVMNLGNPEHVLGTYSFLNLYYSFNEVEAVACIGLYPVHSVEYYLPSLWFYNLAGIDPLFLNLTPTKQIDGTNKAIDFSHPSLLSFEDDFQLHPDSVGLIIKAGAFAE